MFGYSRKREWALASVRFEYAGGTYDGRGLLSWKPKRGFHVEAFLARHGAQLPQIIEFGKVGVIQPNELRAVRMRLEDGARALTSPICVSDHLELVGSPRLSADFPAILFVRPDPARGASAKLCGSAVLDVGKGIIFPDSLERETRLAGERLGHSFSRKGLAYDADGVKLRMSVGAAQCLEADWELSADVWTANDAWRFGEALADSLTFLAGRTVQLLERTVYRRQRIYIQRNAASPVRSLSLLAMAPREDRASDMIDRERLILLTKFFLRGQKEAFVARQMCAQMADASRQRTRAGRELLCATILEAALRTLDSHPFALGDRSWKIRHSMDTFRNKYLGPKWVSACAEALTAQKRLRHRNAHPDWVTDERGEALNAALEQSLDDTLRLVWFYGYVILALAGCPNLEPKFPKPHKQWGPMMTVTTT